MTNTNTVLTLDGNQLAKWQRGRRLYAIERTHRYRQWHPKSLFTACMRSAVYELSHARPIESVTSLAVQQFLAQCKTPGLDTPQGTDTYKLAMDYIATIHTVLEYLSRLTLLTLQPKPLLELTPGLNWQCLSHPDESGVLHRWKFVDAINANSVTRELHSWTVMGDIVAHRTPMIVHFVAVGSTHNSRRSSPWCRAYANPTIANQYRFQSKTGRTLQGDWKPVYYADNAHSNAYTWVDRMDADNVLPQLVQHITVREPDDVHVRGFYRDVHYEHNQIQQAIHDGDLADPLTLPMCRTSCDTPYTCPHQTMCYSTNLTLDGSGLYDKLSAKTGPKPKPDTGSSAGTNTTFRPCEVLQ